MYTGQNRNTNKMAERSSHNAPVADDLWLAGQKSIVACKSKQWDNKLSSNSRNMSLYFSWKYNLMEARKVSFIPAPPGGSSS